MISGLRSNFTTIVDRSMSQVKSKVGDSVLLECPIAGLGRPKVTWSRAMGLEQTHHTVKFGMLHCLSVCLFVCFSVSICIFPRVS